LVAHLVFFSAQPVQCISLHTPTHSNHFFRKISIRNQIKTRSIRNRSK
jgi:hypothetical protein